MKLPFTLKNKRKKNLNLRFKTIFGPTKKRVFGFEEKLAIGWLIFVGSGFRIQPNFYMDPDPKKLYGFCILAKFCGTVSFIKIYRTASLTKSYLTVALTKY